MFALLASTESLAVTICPKQSNVMRMVLVLRMLHQVEAKRAEARRWQYLHEQRDALENEVDRLQEECLVWRRR